MKTRLRSWTRDSLIEALQKLPKNVTVILDGCGCCSNEDVQGITYRAASKVDELPAYAVIRRNNKKER